MSLTDLVVAVPSYPVPNLNSSRIRERGVVSFAPFKHGIARLKCLYQHEVKAQTHQAFENQDQGGETVFATAGQLPEQAHDFLFSQCVRKRFSQVWQRQHLLLKSLTRLQEIHPLLLRFELNPDTGDSLHRKLLCRALRSVQTVLRIDSLQRYIR
jgi:hypothetical protein